MTRREAEAAQAQAKAQWEDAGLVVSDDLSIEIADFGLGDYARFGLGLVVRVNEPQYCSKWLTLGPGQECPTHFHKVKKETFFVLRGEVSLTADGEKLTLQIGSRFTLHPGTRHSFRSEAGAVIEEVSTHDENSDSYFDDPHIVRDLLIEE